MQLGCQRRDARHGWNIQLAAQAGFWRQRMLPQQPAVEHDGPQAVAPAPIGHLELVIGPLAVGQVGAHRYSR
jgi:hypothetical protein